MRKYFSCLAFLATICSVCGVDPSKNDYCSKSCMRDKKPVEHTACKCKKVEKPRELVDTDIGKFRQDILDIHNELRNVIASGKTPGFPSASNMKAVSYDMELEYIARCLAKKFGGDHDKCRIRFNGQIVGQNLAGISIKDSDVKEMATDWYLEYKETNGEEIKKFAGAYAKNGKAIGHFTQFVWARMDRIGCARVWYPDWDIIAYRFSLICDYGDSKGSLSNLIGAAVYQIGDACSKCADGAKCGEDKKYPSLCGKIIPVPTGSPSLATRNTHIVSLMTLFAIFLIYEAIK